MSWNFRAFRPLFLSATLSLASCAGPRSTINAWDPKFDGSPDSGALSRVMPAVSPAGMVVSDDREAGEWGVEILRRGGNAVDAAVATAFALSVTRPHFASLGGGGFLLFCPAPRGAGVPPCQALDFREVAPRSAHRDLYLREGKARTELSQNGALAPGVPGAPAGLLLALEKFGTLSRAKVLSKPQELARKGIRVTGFLERAALERWAAMNPEARRIFGCGRGTGPCQAGDVLRQPELAATLGRIASGGHKGFYRGETAEKMVRAVVGAGGIWDLKDLAGYEPKLRAPLTGKFGEWEIVGMPPPSSGGLLLLQLLGYFARAKAAGAVGGFGSAETLHVLAHAMGLAFADRGAFLGDPAFVRVPEEGLLSSAYLDDRWRSFRPGRAALAGTPGSPGGVEPLHTTHLSVIDREGNAVSLTTTINDNFGSGFVPPGTGVVLNNEMDDFSAQPGVPNLFGLVGAEANAIAPGKRPLSSMSPTVVRDATGRVRLVLGAAGGPRIITSVYQVLLNRLAFRMSLPDAVAAPRLHEQGRPPALRLERFGFAPEAASKLRDMGYTIDETGRQATVHALERFENGRVWGAPDPRGEGSAVGE